MTWWTIEWLPWNWKLGRVRIGTRNREFGFALCFGPWERVTLFEDGPR